MTRTANTLHGTCHHDAKMTMNSKMARPLLAQEFSQDSLATASASIAAGNFAQALICIGAARDAAAAAVCAGVAPSAAAINQGVFALQVMNTARKSVEVLAAGKGPHVCFLCTSIECCVRSSGCYAWTQPRK